MRVEKELSKFPRLVKLKFKGLFEILESQGKLEEPFAKKLSGQHELFELRIRYQGQWRATYAYIQDNSVLILSAFHKKKLKKYPKKN